MCQINSDTFSSINVTRNLINVTRLSERERDGRKVMKLSIIMLYMNSTIRMGLHSNKVGRFQIRNKGINCLNVRQNNSTADKNFIMSVLKQTLR